VFAIVVELLAGRYTATQFNDRHEAEWPPHPARLYSAMVATWADSDDPDPEERAALRWLEEQGAPAIHCGEDYRRSVVTHFAAVNDPSALTRGHSWAQATYASLQAGRQAVAEAQRAHDAKALERAQATLSKAGKKAVDDAAKAGKPTGTESRAVTSAVLEILPENRGKQGRTFPTVLPDSHSMWFTWPGASPGPAMLATLDALLGRVGRIGHSSTLVACRCNDVGPGQDAVPTWVPGGNGNGLRLRVPRVGLLDRLEHVYKTHHGEEPRTLPAGTASYRRPPQEERFTPRRPVLGGDWYVLGVAKNTDSAGGKFPFAYQALAVTRAVRGALLSHGEQPAPEIISGHERAAGGTGPTPPLAKAHLAIAPLMNVGHRRSDGTIFGVALVLPAEATTGDRDAIESALSGWALDGFELVLSGEGGGGVVRYGLEGLGAERATEEREPAWLTAGIAGARKTMRRDYWCRPARRWLSVTPVALDRFPGNLRSPYGETRERAETEAEAGIAQACVNAGLAERPEDVAVTVRLDAPLVGVPVSPGGQRGPGQRPYPGYKTGSQGTPRACVHAEIEFLRGPVQGPVLIGAGRFLGYGLFLPYEGRARTRGQRDRDA
jgi:CRISPR-associated protein Csb2